MDTDYRPRHARPTEPAQLPAAMRGLADLITVISDEEREDK